MKSFVSQLQWLRYFWLKKKNGVFFGKISESFVVYLEDLSFLIIIIDEVIYCHWKLWCAPLK